MNRMLFTQLTIILAIILAQVSLFANDKESRYTDYISALESLQKKEFNSIIIGELHEYLHQFPAASNLDKMHFKLASLYMEKGEKVRAFMMNMEIIYLYPNSEVLPQSEKRVRNIVMKDKKFKDIREQVETILRPPIDNTSREAATFAFIRDMIELNLKAITRPLIKSCERFLRNYPNLPETEPVLFWKAELLAKNKKSREALAEFMKVTYLYDSSPYVTASKLKTAEIFTKKLKMHQKAIFALEEFLLEYPDDPQAAQAQFQLARIIEKEKKTYLEAIDAYAAVAQNYPQSVDAVPALFASAKLYEDKFKEYDQAIRIYTEIVRDFPNDLKAPYAYVEAARIYEKRLKDYFNAANVYFKVYGHYPESSIAPECVYAAAEINEKRLKDYDKAVTYYRVVVDQYPQHKLASKANKRIQKLTKE